ncbi:MAG: Asp-tRNA(Asn)/Glu-tRNA(Gln) amidotransferase subunit GatB [Myxococcales bacterium]|nr:Asp-tRNA(Asn)/Glu-tRNA(Gln) amidotransferase subunit GatB [Myxococcales bacterium]
MTPYESVIGLECHVQLATHSKIFSGASASFGGAPNTYTDPYTLALPGTLPVLNRRAVACALKMSLATGCTIRRVSRFARKHYFYPDLPKGYQISQYDEPIAEHGRIDFLLDGTPRAVRLTRIHMEEDAGKSTHVAGAAYSLVDLNRAGVPLIEVVSEPDLRSAKEAAEYLRAIRQLVRYLGICDGNMEEGSLRCDANVSIRPVGDVAYGTRTELKNMNSFKHVQAAIEYEVARQTEVLESGQRVVQETRLWDEGRGTSHPMRSKEQAHDYRYFPEPDLPPLVVTEAEIEALRSSLPELPLARRARFMDRLGLSPQDAALLTAEREIADYYEQVVAAGPSCDPKRAANWVGGELLRELHRDERPIAQSPVSPTALAELIALVAGGTISGKIAKDVLATMYASGESSKEIVAREGLLQVSDESELLRVCQKVIEANPKQVEKFRGGNDKLLGFFVGQAMKETGGRAHPERVNQILRRLLA